MRSEVRILSSATMRVIFFGTPPFAAEILRYLLDHEVDIVAVVSKPDRPKGRNLVLVPTAVKSVILNHFPEIPLYQPQVASTDEFVSQLSAYQADLFLVVAYGEIIKQSILDLPKYACINVHASLLPKYRGAAPIQRAIINGENTTGITLMHMVRKMDAGDMIRQISVPITPDMTFGELESSLCEVGKKALLDLIHQIETGEHIPRTAQDSQYATLAPKIELEDCMIDWKLPASQIHNLIRGTNPYPGAWCFIWVKGVKKRLKIYKTALLTENGISGEILNPKSSKENLHIAAGEGSLELIEVQLEGKKVLSSEELCRGIPRSDMTFVQNKKSIL